MEAETLNLTSYKGVWLLAEEKFIIPKVKQTFRDQNAGTNKIEIREQNIGNHAPVFHQDLRQGLSMGSSLHLTQFVAPQPCLQYGIPLLAEPDPAFFQSLPMSLNETHQSPRQLASTFGSIQRAGTEVTIVRNKKKPQTTETSAPRKPKFREGLELLAGVASRSTEIGNTTDIASLSK